MPSRRVLLAGLAGLAAAFARPSAAQDAQRQRRLRLLFSAALLQERAASLAASRDTRPEVKAFAAEMSAWRRGHLERLRAALPDGAVPQPGLVAEHEAAREGLEPLDFLALSRRYAEMQVQALEWEIRAYEAASEEAEPSLASFARQTLPDLRRMLAGARRAQEAAGP